MSLFPDLSLISKNKSQGKHFYNTFIKYSEISDTRVTLSGGTQYRFCIEKKNVLNTTKKNECQRRRIQLNEQARYEMTEARRKMPYVLVTLGSLDTSYGHIERVNFN